jgi:DivIVA domain-containing protein
VIIGHVHEGERAERRAALEQLRANNLLSEDLLSEEEFRDNGRQTRRRLQRPPLTRSTIATAMLNNALEAMHPEVTRRHNVHYMRDRLRNQFWVRGYSDDEVDAFLDSLVERQWREFSKRPRLIRPLDDA